AALAAQRLFGSRWAGLFAGGLVLTDGLVFTSSRIAMLDIYAAAFVTIALWCATHANAWGRVGAGLFLGLAFSAKFPALFAVPPILLVALWRHRRDERAGVASWILGLPPLVLLASYAPWWVLWVR